MPRVSRGMTTASAPGSVLRRPALRTVRRRRHAVLRRRVATRRGALRRAVLRRAGGLVCRRLAVLRATLSRRRAVGLLAERLLTGRAVARLRTELPGCT